jgi:hypothetical protein
VTGARLLMRILFIHAFFFTHFLLATFLFTRFFGGGGPNARNNQGVGGEGEGDAADGSPQVSSSLRPHTLVAEGHTH